MKRPAWGLPDAGAWDVGFALQHVSCSPKPGDLHTGLRARFQRFSYLSSGLWMCPVLQPKDNDSSLKGSPCRYGLEHAPLLLPLSASFVVLPQPVPCRLSSSGLFPPIGVSSSVKTLLGLLWVYRLIWEFIWNFCEFIDEFENEQFWKVYSSHLWTRTMY